MTIDEAIELEKREQIKCLNDLKLYQRDLCKKVLVTNSEYHRQLAEWLEELKELREMKEAITSNAEVLEQQGYNKAIDEFADRLTKYLGVENATKYGNKDAEQMRNSYGTLMNYEIAEAIDDVAEQLKAGK